MPLEGWGVEAMVEGMISTVEDWEVGTCADDEGTCGKQTTQCRLHELTPTYFLDYAFLMLLPR